MGRACSALSNETVRASCVSTGRRECPYASCCPDCCCLAWRVTPRTFYFPSLPRLGSVWGSRRGRRQAERGGLPHLYTCT